ncbi:Ku protein [Streptomyces sp. NPDC102462]|uniref:Ku protein n=1 Tax=Streptomyces sp. NPDC102462 TaxID=3366178 RepID=UPI003807D290
MVDRVEARCSAVLLRALQRASRTAVAKFAWHGREQIGLLTVRGTAIALHDLLSPDEIRDPSPAAGPARPAWRMTRSTRPWP